MPPSTWLTRLSPFHSNGSRSGTPQESIPCNADEIFAGKGDSERKSSVDQGEALEHGDRSNEEWLAALRNCDPEAIEALRDRLTRGLLAALRRASFRRRVPRRTEALAEESAHEAISKILADPGAFRNRNAVAVGESDMQGNGGEEKSPEKASYESRFTTWAQKIAVHAAFTKLRRNG